MIKKILVVLGVVDMHHPASVKSYFSSQNECSGTASTYTWQCTNIPKAPNAAGRWDISRSRCVQKVCKPGPFLANGHFDYPRLVC